MVATAPHLQPATRFSRKRALILRAAAQAFGRKGFHATTLENIAGELNVTKASLYYYFSTKEELLYEVHLLSMHDLLHRTKTILAKHDSPAEKLQALIAEHLRLLATDYEGAFLLQQEYELPPSYRAEIVRLRDAYEHRVLALVKDGVQQGVFRAKNPRVAVRMILGAINWLLRWYRSEGSLSVEEIIDAYMDVFVHGLMAPLTTERAGNGDHRGRRANQGVARTAGGREHRGAKAH